MRRVVLPVVGIAVSIVALWVASRGVDLRATADALSHANPVPLVACVAVTAIQTTLRSARWRLLLPRSPGGTRPRVLRLIPIVLIGYLGNAALPARLGEPLRAWLVARRERLDPAEAFGTVVLERVVDTSTLALIGACAALLVGATGWVLQGSVLVAAGASAVLVVLVAGGPARIVAGVRRVRGLIGGGHAQRTGPTESQGRIGTLAGGLAHAMERFGLGGGAAQPHRVIVAAALISASCWVLDATVFWLVGQSLGIPLAPAEAMLICAIAVLGTAAPAAPGYVGTYELAAATVATMLGVPPAPALALAVLAHVISLAPSALAGAACLAVVGVPLRDARTHPGEPSRAGFVEQAP